MKAVNTLESNTSDIVKIDNDEVCRVFQLVVLAVACQALSFLGIVGNVLNILCFLKQGFQDSVNVNLLGLAISDTGCLVTQTFVSIGYNPLIQALEKPFDSIELTFLLAGWPHMIFARVTSLITALITVERCLCIRIPLKVKSIITPRRSGFTILGIFIVVVISVIPWYYANRLNWTFSPEQNRTVLKLTFTPDREIAEAVTYTFIHVIVPFGAFIIIILCTCVLVISLRNKSEWRKISKAVTNAQDLNQRELRVAKMVVAISSLFIVCYFPVCVLFLSMMFVQEMSIGGRNFCMTIYIGGIGLLLETVNSSLNIVIYYNMSSRFKDAFHQLIKHS